MINLENIFPKYNDKKVASVQVIKQVITRSCSVSRFILGIICCTVKIAPFLDLFIVYRAMILRIIMIVFIAPVRMIKPLCLSLINEDAMIAAWDVPSPGKKPDKHDARKAGINDFIIVLFFIFSVSSVCFGIFILSFNEIISVLVPNKPESRGNRGWFMFEFKTINPKVPDNKKIISALSLFLDFKINIVVAVISMYGIIFSIKG